MCFNLRRIQRWVKGLQPYPLVRVKENERAKCSQVVGNHAESIIDFTRVLEMQPTNARALFRRGFSYKALKKYTEAAEDFEAAKEIEPDDPRLVLDYANPKLHEVYENTFVQTKFYLIQALIQKISLSKFECIIVMI